MAIRLDVQRRMDTRNNPGGFTEFIPKMMRSFCDIQGAAYGMNYIIKEAGSLERIMSYDPKILHVTPKNTFDVGCFIPYVTRVKDGVVESIEFWKTVKIYRYWDFVVRPDGGLFLNYHRYCNYGSEKFSTIASAYGLSPDDFIDLALEYNSRIMYLITWDPNFDIID